MKTLNISPALLKDLNTVLSKYSYHLVVANANIKQGNHRYIFTDDTIKLLIEFSKYEKK
jgi:hypothetical protein